MNYDDEIRFNLSEQRAFSSQLKENNAIQIEEWSVANSRIDIAIINGNFVGYEIKSKNDTLEKLEKQITDYSKIFDYITIIIDKKHIKKAKLITPNYVGIVLAEKDFPIEREATLNTKISYIDIAYLLWKEELLELLLKVGKNKIKSKSRYELANIFSNFFQSETADIVREKLKHRYKESSWKKVCVNNISWEKSFA